MESVKYRLGSRSMRKGSAVETPAAANNQERFAFLTSDELKEHTRHTVHETLSALGIDVSNPAEVQRDFMFIRDWRKTTESLKSSGILTVFGIIVAGIVAAFWIGFKSLCK